MLLLVELSIQTGKIIHLARAKGGIGLMERVWHLVVLDMEEVAVQEPAGRGLVVAEVVLILTSTMV